MINKLLFLVFFSFSLLLVNSLDLHAGSAPTFIGEGNGCSALSKPDVDCEDINGAPVEFYGTMGLKALQIRNGNKNDYDLDDISDGLEACICDSLDDNPNINMNTPGDGSVCDSSIQEERDQFVGSLTIADEPLRGQKYEFYYVLDVSPEYICVPI